MTSSLFIRHCRRQILLLTVYTSNRFVALSRIMLETTTFITSVDLYKIIHLASILMRRDKASRQQYLMDLEWYRDYYMFQFWVILLSIVFIILQFSMNSFSFIISLIIYFENKCNHKANFPLHYHERLILLISDFLLRIF